MTLWPAMAGIDAAMAGYGRYRCSYGPKTKIADAVLCNSPTVWRRFIVLARSPLHSPILLDYYMLVSSRFMGI